MNQKSSLIQILKSVQRVLTSDNQLCRPVYERWLDLAVLSGKLPLPGYEAERRYMLVADWLPTKWDWVDPLKDANAEIAQIEAGLKSRTQAIAERGYDAEQVDREIAAERIRERDLGLDFRRPGSPAQGVQGLPVDGKDPDSRSRENTDNAEDRPRPDEDRP